MQTSDMDHHKRAKHNTVMHDRRQHADASGTLSQHRFDSILERHPSQQQPHEIYISVPATKFNSPPPPHSSSPASSHRPLLPWRQSLTHLPYLVGMHKMTHVLYIDAKKKIFNFELRGRTSLFGLYFSPARSVSSRHRGSRSGLVEKNEDL